MKKNYELITKQNGIDVIIKQYAGHDYYNYDERYQYLEVSYLNTNFDNKKLKVIPDKELTYRRLQNENDTYADYRSRDNCIYFIDEIAIIAAEKQVRKNLRLYNAKIQNGFNNPLFLLLKPIADDKVKFYKSDFYRCDNIQLQDEPSQFVWIVRECGTWMFTVQSKFAKNTIEFYTDKDDYYFYSNGNLIKSDKNNIMKYYYQLSK